MTKKEAPVAVDPYFQEITNRNLRMEDVSFEAAQIQAGARRADEQQARDQEYERRRNVKRLSEEIDDRGRTGYAGYLVSAAVSASGVNLSDVPQEFMTELVKSLCLEMKKSDPGLF